MDSKIFGNIVALSSYSNHPSSKKTASRVKLENDQADDQDSDDEVLGGLLSLY